MGNGWIVGSDDNISERRFRILYDLLLTLPNSTTVLASNDPATREKFKEWTGFSQATLEEAWRNDGFKKGPDGWKRVSGNATTTSCEGLIMTIFSKIERYGFGKRKGGATAFNLANVDPKSGKERTPPVGWNWYRSRDDNPYNWPEPGDVYQIGVPRGTGQWTLKHVGMVVRWDENGGHPRWETVEAGQGGPGSGYDSMKRKPMRPVFPMGDSKEPGRTLMGWLDIDAHFE